MFRKTKLYTCMAVVLAVICVIFLSNCGGGGNSSVVPNTNPTTENPVSYTNPTPTPVLSNVNVSGYLYVNNTVTEDGETVPSISVIDVPACQSDSSGNESFLTQFSNSIKADYPEDWVKPEVQELYAQLNKTLSESKPLPEYNAQAQLCSAYDNTSIPVGSDGHFDNTVLTGASDSNVRLEVALGEDNYTEVETLPSSGSINSSDATSAAVLKSCPEKIFAFPGEILIFKVYSEPGINLKSAGLKFALNNPSIGCITQPVYLCLFGAHKYQVAYGCVYIKPGLDTPVDTTITARMNSGQSMSIFLEVIKKTASVSGTVYTGGSTLVKGYVKSLGPKACCKIDASGQYSLLKVFMGHSRTVIATWQTSENGQKIRHREEKVIDFFNADVAGLNFGVPPTPTPTPTFPTSTDKYYDVISNVIIEQKLKWQEELGTIEGIQKTANWLNGIIVDTPLPYKIAQAIQDADVDPNNPYTLWFTFKNGIEACICDSAPTPPDANTYLENKEFYNESCASTIIANSTTPTPYVFPKRKVLMLLPNGFEDRGTGNMIFNDKTDSIKSYFTKKKYEVNRYGVINIKLSSDFGWPLLDSINNEAEAQIEFYKPDYYYDPIEDEYMHVTPCKLFKNYSNTVTRPENFMHMDLNDIIYIRTHGKVANDFKHGERKIMMACPFYLNDIQLLDWIENNGNKGKWTFMYTPFTVVYGFTDAYQPHPPYQIYYKCVAVKTDFIAQNNSDFGNSLIYVSCCDAWELFKDKTTPFNNTRVFIGASGNEVIATSGKVSYNFFKYFLGIDGNPMSAKEAYNKAINPPYGNDRHKQYPIYTGPNNENDYSYLPSDVSVVVCRGQFIIKDETIEELRKEITGNWKIKAIESLKSKIFSQDELTMELKKLSFSEQEIKIILKHTGYKKN